MKQVCDYCGGKDIRASEGADMAEYMDTGGGAVIIAYLAVAVIAGLIGFGVGLWAQ